MSLIGGGRLSSYVTLLMQQTAARFLGRKVSASLERGMTLLKGEEDRRYIIYDRTAQKYRRFFRNSSMFSTRLRDTVSKKNSKSMYLDEGENHVVQRGQE